MGDYVIIVLALVLSAIFSAIEIAFLSADKLAIKLKEEKNNFYAKLILPFFKHSSFFIIVILVGNTISLVVYSIFMTKVFDPFIIKWLNQYPVLQNFETFTRLLSLLISTTVSTFIVLINAEFIPKSISLTNPNRLLLLLSVPIKLCYYLVYPIAWIIMKLTQVLLFKYKEYLDISEEKHLSLSVQDLDSFLANANKSEVKELDKNVDNKQNNDIFLDKKIFKKIINFTSLKVRNCMVPRNEIIAIHYGTPIDTFRKAFSDTGKSRILVYKEDIDNVIGYCHVLDLFRQPESIDDILNDIVIVTEGSWLQDVITIFTGNRKSLALVVDEFGGTSGIITLEDIVEAILGEIHDEHEYVNQLDLEQKNKNTFIISGRYKVSTLNEKYGFNLPEGDYETLGGYVIDINKDLPKVNDEIKDKNFSFRILSMDKYRIDKIEMFIEDY